MALEEMDPLTRGSLFHEVVFELFRHGQTKEIFAEIADEVFDQVAARYEEKLAPAIPRVWKDSLAKHGWEQVFLAGDAYKAFVEEDTKRITGILESLGLRK